MNIKILPVSIIAAIACFSPSNTYSKNTCAKNYHAITHNKQKESYSQKKDSATLSFWEIKNETNHRTITIVSDKEIVEIEPGETKKVYRNNSFNFSIGYPDRYNDKKNKQTFTIEDHSLSVYSRYFGKQGKLQFLIGISKQK